MIIGANSLQCHPLIPTWSISCRTELDVIAFCKQTLHFDTGCFCQVLYLPLWHAPSFPRFATLCRCFCC